MWIQTPVANYMFVTLQEVAAVHKTGPPTKLETSCSFPNRVCQHRKRENHPSMGAHLQIELEKSSSLSAAFREWIVSPAEFDSPVLCYPCSLWSTGVLQNCTWTEKVIARGTAGDCFVVDFHFSRAENRQELISWDVNVENDIRHVCTHFEGDRLNNVVRVDGRSACQIWPHPYYWCTPMNRYVEWRLAWIRCIFEGSASQHGPMTLLIVIVIVILKGFPKDGSLSWTSGFSESMLSGLDKGTTIHVILTPDRNRARPEPS